MKRLIAGLLLAGLMQVTPARAADPNFLPATILPTTPRVPAPVLSQGGTIQASAVSRVMIPLRDRVASSPIRSDAPPVTTPMPLPTGYAGPQAGPYTGYAGGGCPTPDCGTCAAPRFRGAGYDRFKAWLCFRPTAGDALPKFNPHPYVGPIAGTFPCTSAAGCAPGTGTCAPGNGCAAVDVGRGGLAARFGLLGSGCRDGGCVPPADDAIPGYRFAGNHPPATAAPFAPLGYTTYKPAAPAVQPAQAVHPARTNR
jgi:hypothetical protein